MLLRGHQRGILDSQLTGGRDVSKKVGRTSSKRKRKLADNLQFMAGKQK